MPNFEDLPVETIDSIFYHLFRPPHENWSEYMNDPPKVNVEDFISLTGTNRLCRTLALPILFRSIRPSHGAKYIFNVFNCDRDLTKCTKSLDLPLSTRYSSGFSFVEDVASGLGVYGPVVQSIYDGHPETAEVSLALALCSSPERLKIRLPDHDRNTEWQNRSFRPTFDLFTIISCQLGRAPYLGSLRYLEFYTTSHRCYREDNWDLALFDIPLFLGLTPNIEVLVLRGYWDKFYQIGEPFDVDLCRPALESLIEIRLLDWPLTNFEDNDINVVTRIVHTTTRLKTFVYASRLNNYWDEEHPPRRLITMLRPAQSALQHLTLDYGERNLLPHNEGDVRADDIVIAPSQLQRFTDLETLEISQCVYCYHQFDRKAHGATYLTDLLPLTIRRLTIYFPRHDGAVQCLDCILYLGQRAVAGDFPALEAMEIRAHFHQIRSKRNRRSIGLWGYRPWTAEDAARKTLKYDKELAAAARREEGREEKVRNACAGSGVKIRYKASQSIYEPKGFRVSDT